MLKVDEIQNGVVIDHITAGTGMALYHLMELEKLHNASVALLQNVRSQKTGKKDIIKIEGDVSKINFDVLGYSEIARPSRILKTVLWSRKSVRISLNGWSM